MVLAYLVSQLQMYSLLESDIDVKGRAYEEIVGSNLRGDRGEFFTPRNICRMAVAMLDPGEKQLVLGAGGDGQQHHRFHLASAAAFAAADGPRTLDTRPRVTS